MRAEFDKAFIKVWFNTLGTSRNFKNVTEILMSDNAYLIKTSEGNQYILSMANVNMIEEKEAYKLYLDEAYKYTNFYEEGDE